MISSTPFLTLYVLQAVVLFLRHQFTFTRSCAKEFFCRLSIFCAYFHHFLFCFLEDDYINEDLKPCTACTVYLFARTARDKEEWFGRLAFATGAIDKFQRGFKRVFSSVSKSCPSLIHSSSVKVASI